MFKKFSQGAEGLEVHDLLMLRFHRGPVAALRLRLGEGLEFADAVIQHLPQKPPMHCGIHLCQ